MKGIEEYNFCVYCGHRLTKYYLCPKCDRMGIGDPDGEDVYIEEIDMDDTET